MPENTHDYELMAIFVPQLDEQGIAAAIERYTNWIVAAGGAVGSANVWGRRALAYAIKKQTEGVYVLFNFQLPPTKSRDLERNLRIDEQVIRHLLLLPAEA
jgi:small subunit ribosomal protein S6